MKIRKVWRLLKRFGRGVMKACKDVGKWSHERRFIMDFWMASAISNADRNKSVARAVSPPLPVRKKQSATVLLSSPPPFFKKLSAMAGKELGVSLTHKRHFHCHLYCCYYLGPTCKVPTTTLRSSIQLLLPFYSLPRIQSKSTKSQRITSESSNNAIESHEIL